MDANTITHQDTRRSRIIEPTRCVQNKHNDRDGHHQQQTQHVGGQSACKQLLDLHTPSCGCPTLVGPPAPSWLARSHSPPSSLRLARTSCLVFSITVERADSPWPQHTSRSRGVGMRQGSDTHPKAVARLLLLGATVFNFQFSSKFSNHNSARCHDG